MVAFAPKVKGIHIGSLYCVGADPLALQEGHIEMPDFLIVHLLQCVDIHAVLISPSEAVVIQRSHHTDHCQYADTLQEGHDGLRRAGVFSW